MSTPTFNSIGDRININNLLAAPDSNWHNLDLSAYIPAGATGGFGGGGGGTTVNINSQAFAGNTAEARKFATKINRFGREETRIGR